MSDKQKGKSSDLKHATAAKPGAAEQTQETTCGSSDFLFHAVSSVAFDANGNANQGSTYVRTRHNNLRCFPRCSEPHSPSSFCGQSLSGTINWAGTRNREKEIRVIGGFHNLKSEGLLKLGQNWETDASDQMIAASCLPVDASFAKFTFIPNRKWQYSAEDRIIISDLHVFTVYVLEDNKCVATADSSSFHVTPVWTADKEKESQRRTRARNKRKEISRQMNEQELSSKTMRLEQPLKATNVSEPTQNSATFAPPIFPAYVSVSTTPPMTLAPLTSMYPSSHGLPLAYRPAMLPAPPSISPPFLFSTFSPSFGSTSILPQLNIHVPFPPQASSAGAWHDMGSFSSHAHQSGPSSKTYGSGTFS